MKKKVLIIFINILLIMLIVHITNFLIIYYQNSHYNKTETIKDSIHKYKSLLTSDLDPYNFIFRKENDYRKVENINSPQKPIVLFGCSYTYGSDINENETISYHLGQLTKRPIYNRAIGGWGIQHMLYQLRNQELYNIIPSTPMYVIYFFFSGHYQRMYTPCCIFCPTCYALFYKKDKNNNFIERKHNFFSNKIVFFHALMNEQIYWQIIEYNIVKKYYDDLLIDYIIASKKEAEQHWGKDVKFAVFFFDYPFFEDTIKKLNSSNIYTITPQDYKIDYRDKEFSAPPHYDHPSGKYWDIVAPIIVKKLNIN